MRIFTCVFLCSILLNCASSKPTTESTTQEADTAQREALKDVVFQDGSKVSFQSCAEPKSPPNLLGGLANLQKEIVYPPEALKRNQEGRIIYQILIDDKGEIAETNLKEGAFHSLNKEAFRVIQLASFEPATCNGETVSMYVSIPIVFRKKKKLA